MPGMNHKGPQGLGPRTGRGRGECYETKKPNSGDTTGEVKPDPMPDQATTKPNNQGDGMGMRRRLRIRGRNGGCGNGMKQ